MQYQIQTIDEVIAVLGGIAAVARLTNRSQPNVHNWRYAGRFSARVYKVMIDALEQRGLTASPALWGVEENETAAA